MIVCVFLNLAVMITFVNSNFHTKLLRNPFEFCMDILATHVPSNYFGVYYEKSNETINVQNQESNQNAGEGSGQDIKIVVDYDGHPIDLNKLYCDQDENENK